MEDPLYRDVIERMVSLVEDGDGKDILDLGCGTGRYRNSCTRGSLLPP